MSARTSIEMYSEILEEKRVVIDRLTAERDSARIERDKLEADKLQLQGRIRVLEKLTSELRADIYDLRDSEEWFI